MISDLILDDINRNRN